MGHWKRRNELELTHTNQDVWPTHSDPSGLMAQVEKSLFLFSGSSCPEEAGSKCGVMKHSVTVNSIFGNESGGGLEFHLLPCGLKLELRTLIASKAVSHPERLSVTV